MIPFHRVVPAGRELEYVADAVARGRLSGDGWYSQGCERILAEVLGGARVFLTTSCTHALEMAGLLLDLGPGDEFIVPSFTFPSTANAFILRGAKPVFIDVRPDTLNLDEERLASAITPRTKAIIAMHYAGVGAAMGPILDIARAAGIAVVEDNAHGLFGAYDHKPLGTFGTFGALSFHESKNISCGEGGALIVNDPAFVERAEVLREKGTDRTRFFRGEIDRYTWQDVGSSYVLSEILAAFLYGQLEQRAAIQSRRQTLTERYRESLETWSARRGVALPSVPAECSPAYHLFHLLLPTAGDRTAFIRHLRERNVHATFHYQSLHAAPMGLRFGGAAGNCPVTESVSDRLVRLPLFPSMTDAEQQQVLDAVVSF